MNAFSSLIFNRYTFFILIASAGFFMFKIMSNKINVLEESLKIESENVIILKQELKESNEVIERQEKELLAQVDNILILEKNNNNLKKDLQKSIEKRNKKDVNEIILKKEKLTEITVNKFIKKKIKKYNDREGVK